MDNLTLVIAPSLLENIVVGPVPAQFNIGMDDWIQETSPPSRAMALQPLPQSTQTQSHPHSFSARSIQPHPSSTAREPHPQRCSSSRTKDHLPQQPPAKKSRFSALTEQELEELSKPCVPKNTESSTKWALDNFDSWKNERSRSASNSEKCPETLLEDMDPAQLNKWLSVFIAETRKVNGEQYPPASLQLLLSGLQRHMRSVNIKKAPNIFAKKDPNFSRLHQTMDSVYRKLRAKGVGAQRHHTETFSREEENRLWESGVLGVDDPTKLLRAVFFNNGKVFCLRGGEEHRSLKLSQFKRTENGYKYTENSSKNRSGGLAQLHLKNKSVDVYRNPEAGDRCHCRILDVYISKLPQAAKEKDLFYMRPLEKVKPDQSVWYYSWA